ncbi:MAG: hypothetical protein K0S99_2027 [Thermomicrobiales bacterium]|nr:hypothetical protein [Thermomicrobiales bacterium]
MKTWGGATRAHRRSPGRPDDVPTQFGERLTLSRWGRSVNSIERPSPATLASRPTMTPLLGTSPHPQPATHFVGTRPVEPGEGDGQPQRGSKGLKRLKGLKGSKSLNVSGAGEGNTFTCTFTGDAPHPSAAQTVPGPVRRERGKVQREVTTTYCMRPRQATGQTEAMTPSRMPKSDSWRWTAWSV